MRPWSDPLLDQFGHDPRSVYVERFFLPIVGPSTTVLLRHLATRFDDEPDGFELNLSDASRCIGVGTNHAPGAAFFRTLERMISFGLAELIDDRLLGVRPRLASLTRRQVLRLPRRLQHEHDEWLEQRRDTTQPDQFRRRARALALSLFELGEDYDATERQLHRWKFHPAIAHDAVRWASGEHLARAATTESAQLDGAA